MIPKENSQEAEIESLLQAADEQYLSLPKLEYSPSVSGIRTRRIVLGRRILRLSLAASAAALFCIVLVRPPAIQENPVAAMVNPAELLESIQNLEGDIALQQERQQMKQRLESLEQQIASLQSRLEKSKKTQRQTGIELLSFAMQHDANARTDQLQELVRLSPGSLAAQKYPDLLGSN